MEQSPTGKPLASEPAVSQTAAAAGVQMPLTATGKPRASVWLQRVWLVIYVGFCIELGLWLVVAPWRQVWTNNSLLIDYPALQRVLLNYFLRGAVTGLGIIDLGLGISAAVDYREKR